MAVAYSGISYNGPKRLNTDKDQISTNFAPEIATNNPILDIHVSCKNLKKLDVGSESDPMVVMYTKDKNRWAEIARTEVIFNNPNPCFVKVFKAMYVFETQQPLQFSVYDVDSQNSTLNAHDFIGSAETDVQSLVTSGAAELVIDLKDSHGTVTGQICLTSEQCQQSGQTICGIAKFRGLKKMRTFSKNCPYLVLSRPFESGRNLPVFKSEVISKAYTCTFKPFEIPMHTVCLGDTSMPVTITAYDHHGTHPDVEIGSAQDSLANLLAQPGKEYTLQNKAGKNVGFCTFTSLTVVTRLTFLDYLRSGLQLNLITAIDYTASNGSPSNYSSLHYVQPGALNAYESCIWGVGSIVCPYDSDQLFPVYGFGGKVNGKVDHCFPLTFDPAQPNVRGLQGISDAYKASFQRVTLCGPTLFTPIIRAAREVARISYANSCTYTVLLIITDGVINDFREAKDAIVDASDDPMSIIIVGVGKADFSAMDALDCDNGALTSSTGKRAVRDIVQFVPFNQCATSDGSLLAAEVLAEIPKQVQQFCEKHPLPRK